MPKKMIFVITVIVIFFSINLLCFADTDEMPSGLENEFLEHTNKIVNDPFSGYNRMIASFNDKVYFWGLKPTSSFWSKLVPKTIRNYINNFFRNLTFPIRFVNSILQFKIKKAGIILSRFFINTTIGVIGFDDAANRCFDFKPQNEDFGQTLGFYHLGSIFHIEWPFIGPSNVRDTIGFIGDLFLNPTTYIPNLWIVTGIYTFKKINYTSLHLGEYEKLKKEAIDFYPFLRDLYEQNRIKLIKE